MTLFEIGNFDVSEYVNKKTYTSNREDETIEWKDANSVIHTTVVRTRVKARIDLIFITEEIYASFLDMINDSCEDGYWDISLYVNNTHKLENITARIEFTTKPVFGNQLVYEKPVVNTVRLNIEEV